MENKIIICLIFCFSTTIGQAQNNNYIPPDTTQKTHFFTLPELQIDSTFIANLEIILFDKNDRFMNIIISDPNNKWRHFVIHFEKRDSLNYCIEVSLWDIPAKKSLGFFEQNGFFYWFGGDIPPNIILEIKSNKQFSYKEPISSPYDPPFWYFLYNSQTEELKIK